VADDHAPSVLRAQVLVDAQLAREESRAGLKILVVLLALPNVAILIGLFSQAFDESEYLLLHLVVALIGGIPVAFGAVVTLLAAFHTSPLRQDDTAVLSA
jgi:hypothetical protein